MLKISHISKTFNPGTVNEKKAITDLSLELKKGDFATIIGSNGAGKSTLFSHFYGLTAPTSGCVKIEGKAISIEMDELLKVRQKVGIVFQDPEKQIFYSMD